MNDNQNTGNMGEQMKRALSDALQSGDFSDLNQLVSQGVTNALNEVGKHISFMDGSVPPRKTPFQETSSRETPLRENVSRAKENTGFSGKYQQEGEWREDDLWQQAQERIAREQARAQKNWQEHMERAQKRAHRQMQQVQERVKQVQIHSPYVRVRQSSGPSPAGSRAQKADAFPSSIRINRVGSVSNILYQVFGGIGLGVSILMTFLHFTFLVSNGPTNLAGWIVNVLSLMLFMGMIRLGASQRRRLKLAERYAGLCEHGLYGEIEYLAKSTGKKARHVVRDLQKMLKLGMFPEGHLDEKKTCFMLSDSVYRQYLETENNCRLREAESKKKPDPPQTLHQPEAESIPEPSGQESELNTMIAEGMECIRRLRLLNDKIPGEVISVKLSRLESLLKDIFDSLREHPDQMHRMHKLMSYYLPTTLKLVEAYEEFDRVSAPGDDIIAAKAEIENTLDTINQAFTELLNNLFQDAVLDATTDAQVLKTMLAREGLMNEMDFSTDINSGGNVSEKNGKQ